MRREMLPLNSYDSQKQGNLAWRYKHVSSHG